MKKEIEDLHSYLPPFHLYYKYYNHLSNYQKSVRCRYFLVYQYLLNTFDKSIQQKSKRLQLTITDNFSTPPSDNGSRWRVVKKISQQIIILISSSDVEACQYRPRRVHWG